MGLIFKRGNRFKKRIADSYISNKYIRSISKQISSKFAVGKTGARNRFQKQIIDAQRGGLTREEVHMIIGKGVLAGDLTKKKAKELAIDLGLTEKKFRKFKDISEFRDFQKKQDRASAWVKGNNNISGIQDKQLETIRNSHPKDFPVKTNLNRSTASPIESKPQPTLKIVSSKNIPPKNMGNKEDKKNIWDILNRKQHPNAFPDDHTEDQKEAA